MGVLPCYIHTRTCPCVRCSAAGFTGLQCEVNIDDCAGSPCLHEGVCQDLVGDYSCTCSPFYAGKSCEVPAEDICKSNPCKNGGLCAYVYIQKSLRYLPLFLCVFPLFPALSEFGATSLSSFALLALCQCFSSSMFT